ncbi:MAG: hypothetical protein IM606_06630 [Cytophagales bacterium]|nr:hypothetical protein [Cytophagales bacterium]MCA6386896.1 hypothetical protein [Cytophagales bacterium]MCA6393418.1 hypothetical protein [Cytophagales bacterium]MCA6394847.1 hypothetical protein [Cytophagales bacterium]MCA6400101.1 hypothetical protein [Cytophagales bacterium]
MIKTLIVVYSIITVFHSCILLKIIPYDITWGGRLQNDQEMYVFETTSIAINLFLISILSMKGNFVTYKFPVKVIHVILWVFVVVFALNTVGNLFAKTLLEKAFTLLTLGSALAIGFVLRRPLT